MTKYDNFGIPIPEWRYSDDQHYDIKVSVNSQSGPLRVTPNTFMHFDSRIVRVSTGDGMPAFYFIIEPDGESYEYPAYQVVRISTKLKMPDSL